jgi:hypothetical protein
VPHAPTHQAEILNRPQAQFDASMSSMMADLRGELAPADASAAGTGDPALGPPGQWVATPWGAGVLVTDAATSDAGAAASDADAAMMDADAAMMDAAPIMRPPPIMHLRPPPIMHLRPPPMAADADTATSDADAATSDAGVITSDADVITDADAAMMDAAMLSASHVAELVGMGFSTAVAKWALAQAGGLKVRKTPCRPRSWANLSLF